MKTLNIIGISIFALLLSCTGTSSDKGNPDSTADTAQSIDVENETMTDSVLITPDLSFAEVKGKVKEVRYCGEYGPYMDAWHFDIEGNLIKDDQYEDAVYTRNDNGEIIAFESSVHNVNISWENGYPRKAKTLEPDGTQLSFLYIYNSKGYLLKEVVTSDGPDGKTDWSINYKYSDDSFDEIGNWIKRESTSSETGQTITEHRLITYF